MAEPGILVVDVGGNNVKLWCANGSERRRRPSGPGLTPDLLLAIIAEATGDWEFDRITIGFPGPVRDDRIVREPVNLGSGWAGYDFGAPLGKPVRMINDAAMQALGSYEGGIMLFLGLGTGLGTTLVADRRPVAMEIGHLPWKKSRSYEDYLGQRGLVRLGRKRWREVVAEVAALFRQALVADYVVLGGGNAKLIDPLPEHCRRGDNALALKGGVRLWELDA